MNIIQYLAKGYPFVPVNRSEAVVMLDFIEEAWTAQAKEDAIKAGAAQGYRLVGHKVAGGYDIALWRNETAQHNKGTGFYCVSVNSQQINPLNPEEQFARPAPESFPFREVASIIDAWMKEYGDVVIGSFNPERTKKYMALLRRSGYRYVPFVGNDYRYGAIVSPKTIYESASLIVEMLLRDAP